jgi:hypothetical protein
MPSHLDPHTYILVDRKPVQHANDEEWWAWFCNMDNRRVGFTEIGNVTVSTIFFSLDLRPQRGMLFETKIFGGEHDGKELLAATWEEAELNHLKAVGMQGRAA